MNLRKIKGKIINIGSIILTPFPTIKKCMNTKQTIEKIIKENKSIIRFGDGEFRILLNKKAIEYQEYDENLRKELKKIVEGCETNNKYILALPSSMFTKSILWYLKNNKIYIDCFGAYRFYFRYCMSRKCVYGDAFCFSKGNEKLYSSLWKKSDIVIFVHNNEEYAKKFYNQYGIKTEYIQIPSKNAYSQIENIMANIKKKIKELPVECNYKVLISAGPAAKPIVYRLLEDNIVAYDTGHCWDDPLTNPEGD